MRCPQCQQETRSDGKFCRRCGAPIASRQTAQSDQAVRGATLPLASPPRLAVAPPPKPESPHQSWPSGDFSVPPSPALSPANQERRRRSADDLEMPSVRPEDFSLAPPTSVLIGPFQQAGFGLRFGAALFDFALCIVWLLVTLLAGSTWTTPLVGWIGTGGLIGFTIVNFVLLPIRTGQTIGKRIIGIQIVGSDFSKPTAGEILTRHILGYPLGILSAFLGFAWILWDRRQQGWHDKLAHTIVVRIET